MIRFGARVLACALVAVCGCNALAQTNGPDVLVGDLPDFSNNNATTINGVVYDSFAVGTTSCNKGNTVLAWTTTGVDNRHPAISQNMYRLRNGQFEQIGQGWLKHGFTALQGTICETQFGYHCTPFGSGAALGIGCSDPYSASLNNVSGGNNLGPKWQVNAATGLFPYPWTAPTWPVGSPAADIGPPRVRLSELNTLDVNDHYFMEGQYICGDDAAFGNKNNNASWREVTLAATAGTVPAATNFAISGTGATTRELPAIYAWKTLDTTVSITTFDVPSDGRFILASKVTGTGPYTYEYALLNLNSHRCAGSFTVPLPSTHAALTAVGFHDCEVVGEPNALANPANPASDDWIVSGGAANTASIVWTGPAYSGTPPVYTADSTYKVTSFTPGTGNDHTANVLRWGMLFNFRFTSSIAPSNGTIGVGLWRPGTGTSFAMTVQTPGGAMISGSAITASCCTGIVCSVVSQTACAGTWGAPGSTCAPTDPCDTGSCCHTGVCTITASTGCLTGSFTQNGTCSPNNCPAVTGICCVSTTCSLVTQANCTGTWTNGSSCASNPCDPSGACCNLGTCSITLRSACSSPSTWNGATSCTTNPCPQPGACCSNNACILVLQAACTGSGTAWNGATSCASVICNIVNNLCANAIPVCDGVSVTGTTAGATAEGAAVSCGSSTTTPDVWFTYVPAVNVAAAHFNTCGSAYDTVLSVYTGSCGALVQMSNACNDDSYNGGNNDCGTNNLGSGFNAALTAGTPYFVRVSGYNGNTGTYIFKVTGGAGQGCITTGACCNGFVCSTTSQTACAAPGVFVGGACSPSNPCNPTGACCSGTTCLTITQSSCASPEVWNGGACTTSLCDPSGSCCNDAACTVVSQSACTLTFAAGGTCGGGAANPCNPSGRCCQAGVCNVLLQHTCQGSFTADGTCSPNPCPPLSDDCANRAGIPLGSIPFDTTNATTDGPTHAACAGSGDSQIAKDVWFNHPCQFDGTLDIDTCGSTFDTKLAVYDGYGCADYDTRLMACNDDSTCAGSTLQSKVTINVLCGHHYTIRVGGYTNGQGVIASGAGTLTLTSHPVAQGACCDASGACAITYQSCCTTTWNGAAACSGPNPCPQPTGACCNATACTIVTQAACTGSFKGVGTPCQGAPNPTTCCIANFNQINGLTVQDVFDYLTAWFNGNLAADVNGGGLQVQDIFDFLSMWFQGC